MNPMNQNKPKCPLRVFPYGLSDTIPICNYETCTHFLLPNEERFCPCHSKEEKKCGCNCHNTGDRLIIAQCHNPQKICSVCLKPHVSPPISEDSWEKEFDRITLYEYEEKCPPFRAGVIKDFIRQTLVTEKERSYDEGWEDGRQILKDVPSYKETRHALLVEIKEMIENLSVKDWTRADGTTCEVVSLKDLCEELKRYE